MLNLSHANAAMKQFLAALIFTGFLLVAAGAFFIAGPAFESTFFPVVRDMTFTVEGKFEDAVLVSVSGVKARACTFLEITGLSTVNGHAVYTTVKQNTQPYSRAIGNQSFGIWTVAPIGQDITLYSRHNCHNLWITTTKLGVIRVPLELLE